VQVFPGCQWGHGWPLYLEFEVCYKPEIEDIAKAVHFPAPNLARQDANFSRAFAILREAATGGAFPGACIAVVQRGTLVALKAFGHLTSESGSPAVIDSSIFDLASVTKVVATAAAAMILYERGTLDLEAPVASIIPQFAGDDPRRNAVSVRMLLAHSSGLPAYEKLFLKYPASHELLQAAFSVPLAVPPATRAEYSDIGFIILGKVLERIADQPLDAFCRREIFGPLGMVRTAFNPPAPWKHAVVPAADDHAFRGRIIQGEVQDENASVLGGVAGHAGLFSTAHDLAVFANSMLHGGEPLVRPATLALFTRRETSPAGTSRALGWDTPSAPSQSGRYFSPHSFGHLGYTGTSLWMDAEKQIAVVLLTNRTWPDCSNQQIKQVRPAVHDAVLEALRPW
jgi:serine-type D-Ala-D-Ala carboxypeptidase